MGSWGTKLFDDDEAADLRAGYRTYLADAQSDAGATDLSAKTFCATLERPGDREAGMRAALDDERAEGR